MSQKTEVESCANPSPVRFCSIQFPLPFWQSIASTAFPYEKLRPLKVWLSPVFHVVKRIGLRIDQSATKGYRYGQPPGVTSGASRRRLVEPSSALLNLIALPYPNTERNSDALDRSDAGSCITAMVSYPLIRTAAGKAAGCGARAATARPGSRKAARAQCPAPCTSSFGPIHWRTEVRRTNLNAPRGKTAVPSDNFASIHRSLFPRFAACRIHGRFPPMRDTARIAVKLSFGSPPPRARGVLSRVPLETGGNPEYANRPV
jgi:hypothetical protein